MRYAESTTVPVERSKAEIEGLLMKYGADQFMSGWNATRAVIQFRMSERFIRFELPIPDRNDKRFKMTPAAKRPRSVDDALKAWEQAQRQAWRALLLAVKAKLEAIEAGISTFENEFLAFIVLPNDQTVGQYLTPRIAQAYAEGKMPTNLPLLEGPRDP